MTIPPLEVLFGNPERVMPQLSPDGARLSWLAPVDGVLNVWVRDLAGDDEGRPVTQDIDRGIRNYGWAADSRHLLYLQDNAGDENWHIHTVDLESGTVADRTPFKNVQAQLVATSTADRDSVLIGINKDNPQLHDTYRLTLSSGAVEKVFSNPGFVGVVADHDLQVKAAVQPLPDGGQQLLVRDGETWRTLLEVGQPDALATSPVGFSADGSTLFALSSVGADRGRLVRLDVATGAETVLYEDDTYDVTGALCHPVTGEPLLVAVVADRLRWAALDPVYEPDLLALQDLGHGDLNIVSTDESFSTWLVARDPADGSAVYYVYDRATRTARELMRSRPELDAYELADTEPFTFTARDGLRVSGYVSFPPGRERSQLPAVLNVHGGPWARDTYGFRPDNQLLATRGYVAIQVNYRGSTGYGKAFTSAGDKQWAAAMHDDLLDAVDYCVQQGWVDPTRVGIYGGSYGGYATLVGMTFTPETFVCGVDVVGPSDLESLIRSFPEYWKPMIEVFTLRCGDPDTEPEFLKSRSPLTYVDRIVRPLLIAQGAHDPRVVQEQSELIVAAMRERNIPVEYLLYDDEGHGFAKPENRLHFYAAMERFLAEHHPV
jgi:dipeptidyl aminopeptidase/acylaminoacyl peptidase